MKKVFLLFLFTSFCFSQKKEYAVFQIDSIVKIIRPNNQASGTIRNKKNKIIGGFSITDYKLSKSNTIKGIYSENTKSKNSYSYDYYTEIYYNQNKPFYIVFSVTRKGKKDLEETQKFELNKTELESDKEIKNTFLLNLRKKIKYILSQIIIDK